MRWDGGKGDRPSLPAACAGAVDGQPGDRVRSSRTGTRGRSAGPARHLRRGRRRGPDGRGDGPPRARRPDHCSRLSADPARGRRPASTASRCRSRSPRRRKRSWTRPRAPPEIPDNDCPANFIFLGASEILPPTVIDVVADVDGSFEAEFTPETFGNHEVEVRDLERGHTGEASFEVFRSSATSSTSPTAPKRTSTDKHGIEAEAEQLTETTGRSSTRSPASSTTFRPSPAKDEAKAKLAELQSAMKALRAQGASPEWVNGMGHLVTLQSVGSEMRVATMGLSARLKGWHAVAKRANARASTVLAEVTRGNLLCDQLDVAINGLKAVDFFLGLLTEPIAYFADWAIENDADEAGRHDPGGQAHQIRHRGGRDLVEGHHHPRADARGCDKGHFKTELTVRAQQDGLCAECVHGQPHVRALLPDFPGAGHRQDDRGVPPVRQPLLELYGRDQRRDHPALSKGAKRRCDRADRRDHGQRDVVPVLGQRHSRAVPGAGAGHRAEDGAPGIRWASATSRC